MILAKPTDSSKPKLATGVRCGGTEEARVVLFPEGAIRVQGSGQKIVELCDGERTFSEVVTELALLYSADAVQIREDAATFLERLHDKRIVDY